MAMIERYAGQDTIEGWGCIFLIFLLGFAFLLSMLWEPDPVPVAEVEIPIPTITMDPYAINGSEPEPTTTPYVFSEWGPGWRLQGQNFSWRRENVTGINGEGLKDMIVHTTVYGWKTFHEYDWMSEGWNQYYTNYPDPGKKFLVIYVVNWMDGDTPENDPGMWGFEQDHYSIKYKDKRIWADRSYQVNKRIRELEEISDYGDSSYIRPYGFDWIFSRDQNESSRENAGWTAAARQWIRMGFSNRWDGYIIYQIPDDAQIEELSVIGEFSGFGSAEWKLTV